MVKKLLLICFSIVTMAAGAAAQTLQTPAQFLGYKIGDRYTHHHRLVEYFKQVAGASKNVKLQEYGTTNEGRPQIVAFVGSEENIARLEEIRNYNLNLAGMDKQVTQLSNAPVIVWLSYNVHGNEPASSEAAMQTLYDVANPNNTRTREWLKNTVIVIDPCLNPDGRDRYVNTYTQYGNLIPDANPAAREHTEPWPGGRISHYYFDLNRDWAWQTQKETRNRVALYNKWLPQIHVDFHEQSYNSPYYFAPAAEPFHKVITNWQREFQTTIGKNNARYFDENGWMYFTRERFDLLYPSYGDTYPLYNGSIGMTYEQGGIGGGLAVLTRGYDTLTLADRVAHHHSNSLSTIETASKYGQKVLDEYKKFFSNSAANPPGDYKTYVIKNENKDKLSALATLLNRNGIKYHYGIKRTANGFNYFSLKNENLSIEANDMVIDAYQPKSVLLSVLMEPKTFVADSNTYDITAWSLPYAYGLKAYGLKESLKADSKSIAVRTDVPMSDIHSVAYACVSSWQSVEDVKFLSALLKQNIRVRFSEIAFEAGGSKYPAGSLIITRAGNNRANFDQLVISTANKFNRNIVPLTSGFVDKGGDIGSQEVHLLAKPRVMLLTNDGTYSLSVGEVWHFFEQEINYPLSLVRYQDLGRVRLTDFDVIIMPDGSYPDFKVDQLQNWVKDGGKLIAMQDAISQLVEKKGFDIKLKDEDKKDDKNAKNKKDDLKTYGEREHESLKTSVPGAIYKMRLDNTHPLGFGLPNYYYTLKLDDKVYANLSDGWNVGTIKKDAWVAGFVGQTSKEKIADGMLLGVQSLGRGTVVYMVDDPLFREFWENGKLLFANAVFMVGQ